MVTAATDPVLTRYLALNEDLVALSAETGQSIPALLDWLHSPEIAPTVARFRAHRAHQLTTFALNALAAIISSTPDLTEQRRAATTILKTLTGPAAPRPRTRPSDPGPFDDEDDLQDYADDLAEDDLDDDDLDDGDLDEGSLDGSAEADLNGTEDLAPTEDLDKAPAPAAEVEVKHPTSPAPVPPLRTQHSAPSTPSGSQQCNEAAQMRACDNRYANYDFPPSTGPPR